MLEALESNDWAQLNDDVLSDFGDFETGSDKSHEMDPENMDFGFDKADFEGLRAAIWASTPDAEAGKTENGLKQSSTKDAEQSVENTDSFVGDEVGLDEGDVLKVEGMMRKLQTVREAGEGMSEEQRKRMAARAVEEVMKEL